jgi:hypothetical protein
LLSKLMDSIDFYTCTSPDLVLRLSKLGMADIASHILVNAPQMYAMMKASEEWTDTASVDALEPLTKRAEAPDHLDAWLPQRLDFYRGGPSEFVVPVAEGQGNAQGEQAISTPAGFVAISVPVSRLPSLHSSTFASTFLSTSRTLLHAGEGTVAVKLTDKQALLASSSASLTPVLSARRPPPQTALPAVPLSPSASQTLNDPIRLDESSEEQEDEVDDEVDDDADSSSHGSPLLGRQQSMLMKSATWEGVAAPIVPREAQPGEAPLVLASSRGDEGSDVGTSSFADIMNSIVGAEQEDSAMLKNALACSDETVALYELGLFKEALGQASGSLVLFGKIVSPEEHLSVIRRTAAFKQLLIILLQLGKQESGSPKIAFYSTLAASLEFIDAEHRLPLIERAVSVNKEAGNFRVVRILLTLHQALLPLVENSEDDDGKAVDAQEWCSYFHEKVMFSPDHIMTSTDQFVTCPQCLASSLVADLGPKKRCLICGGELSGK